MVAPVSIEDSGHELVIPESFFNLFDPFPAYLDGSVNHQQTSRKVVLAVEGDSITAENILYSGVPEVFSFGELNPWRRITN